MSLKLFTDPEKETRGTWFPFTLRAEGEAHKVEIEIRRVSPGKDDQLTFRHFGRKMTMRFKKGVQLIERDPEKYLAYAIDKASFAMLGARGDWPPLEACDEGAAALLSEVMSRPVPVGDLVPLVGTWSPALKKLVFNERRDLLTFINTKADELAGAEAEEEEGLGKT